MKLSYPLHNNHPVTGTERTCESIYIPALKLKDRDALRKVANI